MQSSLFDAKAVDEWRDIVRGRRESTVHRVAYRVCSPHAKGGGLLAAMLQQGAQPGAAIHSDLLVESMELGIVLTLEQPIEGIHAKYHSQGLHPGSVGRLASSSAQMRLQVSLDKFTRESNKLVIQIGSHTLICNGWSPVDHASFVMGGLGMTVIQTRQWHCLVFSWDLGMTATVFSSARPRHTPPPFRPDPAMPLRIADRQHPATSCWHLAHGGYFGDP